MQYESGSQFESDYKLENDPQCGQTRGGKEECTWDCEVTFGDFGQEITNPECLRDCFEDTPCVAKLLDDPTCCKDTEEALRRDNCIKSVYEKQPLVYSTISGMVGDKCFGTVADTNWLCFQLVELSANYPDLESCKTDFEATAEAPSCSSGNRTEQSRSNSRKKRLAPLFQTVNLTDGGNIRTKLDFENTKHRYPWICSLRSTKAAPSKEHFCAVTLLRRPPGPTVLVGAAHCTFLCKSETDDVVNSCCCATGPESCANNVTKCGAEPIVSEMTNLDAEILCGEWETGRRPSSSGEEYNIIIPIKKIVRHPDFDTSSGPGTGNDIAVFKVEDEHLRRRKLIPTCLPESSSRPSLGSAAVHSGWFKPPPRSFLEQYAKPYTRFYRDFFKQWHYQMEIEECKDPLKNPVNGEKLKYPSNSFYPEGTMCAKESTRMSCFSSGSSGSPLMIKQSERYYTEGILSFIKGCDVFAFGVGNSRGNRYFLNQQSENPSVYTKLSCFLPWIASQYGLTYDGVAGDDCESKESFEEVSDDVCRNTPSNFLEAVENIERPCIFPFYYDGKKYESCVLFNQMNFVYPTFRCPIRNITSKIEGINSFKSDDLDNILTGGLCQDPDAQGSDELPPISTNITDCSSTQRRVPFSQCKNDCPGGKLLDSNNT